MGAVGGDRSKPNSRVGVALTRRGTEVSKKGGLPMANTMLRSTVTGRSAEKRQTAGFHGLMAVLLVSLLVPGVATAGKPDIDPSWMDGTIVYMIGPHLVANPNPSLYAKSEELYLLVYPINPTGSTTLGALTLPS